MDPAEHIRAFNAAVTSDDWTAFADRFTGDAVLEFVGPPVGPFNGQAAIAAAYAASPPDDTIEPDGPSSMDGDELVVPFRWSTSGATGTMRITPEGDRIARLLVAFD